MPRRIAVRRRKPSFLRSKAETDMPSFAEFKPPKKAETYAKRIEQFSRMLENKEKLHSCDVTRRDKLSSHVAAYQFSRVLQKRRSYAFAETAT